MRKLAGIGGLLFVLCIAEIASAQPQGEGFKFGTDELIVPVAQLSEEQKAFLKEMTETELDFSVGFAWRCAFVGHPNFSFWNWRGRYVLFDGGNVIEFPQADLPKIVGPESSAQLHPPLLYRLPVGLTTVLTVIVIGIAACYFFPGQFARSERLLKDPRYVRAIAVYDAALPGPDEESSVELRRLALATAIDYLVSEENVPRPEAEANLRTIVSLREELRSKQLRQEALAHEMAGAWDEALDLYEEAAELRELWDAKDYAYLQKCIERVEKKQAAA
jgi:hypothetical protein